MTAPLSRARSNVPVDEAAVHAAVASVDDPEYPGISIVDLGLLETLDIELLDVEEAERAVGSTRCRVTVGLVPTFSGCPALAVIAEDVSAAVAALPGVSAVEVRWLATPVWSPDRVSHDARQILADSFTVAVQINGLQVGSQRSGTQASCPRCGELTNEQSMFGPSRCRSVHRCSGCGEAIEVLRA
ncbi:MAG: iron-sulfur cluster assembly protein [Acidimicrobiales bacterium]